MPITTEDPITSADALLVVCRVADRTRPTGSAYSVDDHVRHVIEMFDRHPLAGGYCHATGDREYTSLIEELTTFELRELRSRRGKAGASSRKARLFQEAQERARLRRKPSGA